MRTLSPLPWLCTVATTLPPLRNGEPILTLSPCPTSSTLSNSTLAPASAVSFSTRNTEPSLTRYCLPPVEITAYMSTRAPDVAEDPAAKGRAVYGERGSLASFSQFSAFKSFASVKTLVDDDLHEVDRVIRTRLASDVVLINQIADYIIGSGGKRLRPLVVLVVG